MCGKFRVHYAVNWFTENSSEMSIKNLLFPRSYMRNYLLFACTYGILGNTMQYIPQIDIANCHMTIWENLKKNYKNNLR